MVINELSLPISITDTRNIISRHMEEFGVFFDYDRICDYMFHFETELKKDTAELRRLTGIINYVPTNRNQTLDFLINRLNIPSTLLTNNGGKLTVDKNIIEQLSAYYAGTGSLVEEFLTLYTRARSNSTALSSYAGYKDLPFSKSLDRDGHRMLRAVPKWNILRTSRLSASDPGVQTIDRNRGDIITAPRGYQIVRSDSGQIEPRIMWSHFLRDELMFNLIKAYDDAYFAYFDFVTMKPDRERALRENFSKNFVKNEITQEMKDGRQQMKRISLAAGYGSSLPKNSGFDQELGRLYIERIVNHPMRAELEKSVRKYVNNGGEVFYGAFGSTVHPEATDKYHPGAPGWREHLIRCGINNPIQTTASELMIHAVYNAERILRTKCHNSHICYYKHDEGCFYLNEDAGDMDFAEELAACQSYEVANWIPIHSEMEVGRKEPHNDVIRVF